VDVLFVLKNTCRWGGVCVKEVCEGRGVCVRKVHVCVAKVRCSAKFV
jgi:hypothetical protein